MTKATRATDFQYFRHICRLVDLALFLNTFELALMFAALSSRSAIFSPRPTALSAK